MARATAENWMGCIWAPFIFALEVFGASGDSAAVLKSLCSLSWTLTTTTTMTMVAVATAEGTQCLYFACIGQIKAHAKQRSWIFSVNFRFFFCLIRCSFTCRRLLSNVVQNVRRRRWRRPRRCWRGLKGFGRKGKMQTYVNLWWPHTCVRRSACGRDTEYFAGDRKAGFIAMYRYVFSVCVAKACGVACLKSTSTRSNGPNRNNLENAVIISIYERCGCVATTSCSQKPFRTDFDVIKSCSMCCLMADLFLCWWCRKCDGRVGRVGRVSHTHIPHFLKHYLVCHCVFAHSGLKSSKERKNERES